MNPEYALSIKQPWAWLICAGYKDIENRQWKIGRKKAPYYNADYHLTLPTRIYVHASKTMDETGWDFIMDRVSIGIWNQVYAMNVYTLGAIIGEVDIIGCVEKSDSSWFVGKYGFVLKNPTLYEKPIPCRGMVGFFKPNLQGVGS